MILAELLKALPATGLGDLAFPRRMLGAFRRKSITFCTGLTDETTQVFWFQSRSFTIDLRLPDGAATPLKDRQGWIGDTLWNAARQEMSWSITRSYQPRDLWPEPARFGFIGNSVLEFAPSGAYVEDWRQQSTRGPLLGLRLQSLRDEATGQELPMDGGLIVAGEHIAYTQSRLPPVDEALRRASSLDRALAEGLASESEIASYEVSIAMDGAAITHGTQPARIGEEIAAEDFALDDDGTVILTKTIDDAPCRLRFSLDLFLPDFAFDRRTDTTSEAEAWMEREAAHLARHARITR